MLLAGLLGAGVAQASGETTCRAVQVPVRMGPHHGPIAGTLCAPPGATSVQVLVHGWTYDRHYFDWPYQPDTYSYARAANRAGYATLAIDRPGAGASLKPASLFDTFNGEVNALHTVIQALRHGKLGTNYDKVMTVGHSLGSLTVAQEAGQFKDVDAVVTTGFTHMINYTNVAARVAGRDHFAMSDPKFAGTTSDPLYMTNIPGTRETFFHHPNTDPNVIAHDETLKATDSLVNFATGAAFNVDNVDRTLNIPVLVVTGNQDLLFCGIAAADCSSERALVEHERPWYGPKARIEAYVPPNTGHNTQLEKTAPQSSARMIEFSDKYIGAGGGRTGTAPGVRPEIPQRRQQPVPPAAALADKAFTNAVLPVANTYERLVRPVPGLGNTMSPVPGAGHALATIANINNRILGNLPAELVANL